VPDAFARITELDEAILSVAEGSFFGHIGYISVVATKPA